MNATTRLRALAKHRHLRRAAVLLLPALSVVLVDIGLRGGRIAQFPPKYFGSYGFAMVHSAIVWGVLLGAASARRGRLRWLGAVMFVGLATVAVGTQVYFFRQYSTYLNLDATLWGRTMGDSVFGQLSADGAHFVWSVLPPALAAVGLVWVGRRWIRTRRRTVKRLTVAAPVALSSALLMPCSYRSIQGSTPDVIYFHAVGGLMKQLSGWEPPRDIRPMRRTPPTLPPLKPAPSVARNVLFILTESIRADLGCSSPKPQCKVMPFTNEAAPQRMGLTQMRSSSSTTAIQLAVLWSGLEPNAGREALHTAPLLFDYAHAAGIDTAYWSSHHMMFANSRLYVMDLPTSFQCGATHLDPLADIDLGADDRLLTERITAELSSLREPFMAVAHYGNTHVPYLVDEQDAPFQPALASKDQDDNEAYKHFYMNAVHRQDKTIAELIRHVKSTPLGERTVIVYTADHGEQFREHGQLGHTGSLFDVEILVPTWIDAPEGTLTDNEAHNVQAHRDAFTFHTDITPTILDLMGLWDAPELASVSRHDARRLTPARARAAARAPPHQLQRRVGLRVRKLGCDAGPAQGHQPRVGQRMALLRRAHRPERALPVGYTRVCRARETRDRRVWPPTRKIAGILKKVMRPLRFLLCVPLLLACALLASSCASLLDVENHADAVAELCAKVASECPDGDTIYPQCTSVATARLVAASPSERRDYLNWFNDNGCLSSCVAALVCLDIKPLCATAGTAGCEVEAECCGFFTAGSVCSPSGCCKPNGVRCLDGTECCGGSCDEIGGEMRCGGVECAELYESCVDGTPCCNADLYCGDSGTCTPCDDFAPCWYDEQCCSKFCNRDDAEGPGLL